MSGGYTAYSEPQCVIQFPCKPDELYVGELWHEFTWPCGPPPSEGGKAAPPRGGGGGGG